MLDDNKHEAPMIRRRTYADKYSIGLSTLDKWTADGRLQSRKVGKLVFVEDRLPNCDRNQGNPKN